MDQSARRNKKKVNPFEIVVIRYSRIVTIVLVIFIIAFSYYFILQPKYEQVGIGGRYNLDTLDKELAKRKDYLSNLKNLQSNYQKISQKELDKLSEVLPKEKEVPSLLVALEDLSLKNNFLLSSISINEVSDQINLDNSKIKKMNISLNLVNATGDGYNDLKNFLSDLEYNLRFFDVNAVYFNPESSYYSVNIFTYYQPD